MGIQQGVELATFGKVAKELGGLTWKQSQQIIAQSPHLKPNARFAFGFTAIGNSLMVTGALEVGIGIGSMINEIPISSSQTVSDWISEQINE